MSESFILCSFLDESIKIYGKKKPAEHPRTILDDPNIVDITLSFLGNQLADNLVTIIMIKGYPREIMNDPTITQ